MKRICYVLAALLFLAAEGSSIQSRDLFRDAMRRAEKEATEKNFRELKKSAAGLATFSNELSDEISQSNKYVISARTFDRLDRTKQIRDKAKGW